MNLFALCSKNDVKRIPLTEALRVQIEELFNEQKNQLKSENLVLFSGSWKAEDDELFYIATPKYLKEIISQVEADIVSLDILDLNQIDDNPIKALFMYEDNERELLIQKFQKNQVLQKKFALFLDGDTYNKIDNKAITLDNKLLCLINEERVFFKNFSNMRIPFPMQEFYVEASDVEIDKFFRINTNTIEVSNITELKNTANQRIRKLVHNLSQNTSILQKFTVQEIEKRAKKANLDSYLTIKDNKIIFPQDKEQLINVLSILDEKLYHGAFSNQAYITNSNKIVEW